HVLDVHTQCGVEFFHALGAGNGGGTVDVALNHGARILVQLVVTQSVTQTLDRAVLVLGGQLNVLVVQVVGLDDELGDTQGVGLVTNVDRKSTRLNSSHV